MDTRKGLIAWFVRNPVAANLLMIVIIAAGLFGVSQVRKESFPNLEFNVISVQIPYLGAAPQEVEKGVVLGVEQAVEGLDGIEKVTSTAGEGLASVSIQVLDGFDIQEVMNEVKMRIDAIPNLPENTENASIYRIRPKPRVMSVQVYGDLSERALKELAKDVRDDLLNLSEVSSVDMSGARDYEVSIEVSEDKLREYELSIEDVIQAVRNSSIDLPGGSIKSENREILLRTRGQAYRGDEFEKIVLLTRPDGTRLRVSDVATVIDGFVESQRYSLFNGYESVGLQVYSVGDQDMLKVAKQVKAYVDERQAMLPDGVQIDYWSDQSYNLQGRIDLMLGNLIQGAIMVFLVMSLFLRIRLAAWVMVGLPVCFLGTLMLMPIDAVDVSINMFSLFGFILVLGIVVDDAIIIGESVHAEVEAHGHSHENVIRGAQRVAMPATFGVLTTIAAFLPMLLVEGVSSAIWESIGWVVILCLVFSLVESKWILPAHLAHMKPDPVDTKPNLLKRFRTKFNKAFMAFVHNGYAPFLAKCLRNRYTTLASFIAVLMVTIGIVQGGIVRFVLFPNLPADVVNVDLTMIEGTPARQTILAMETLEAALQRVDDDIASEIGESVVGKKFITLNGDSAGRFTLELVKESREIIDAFEVANRWREEVPVVAGVKSLTITGSVGTGPGSDISFQLTGKNLESLGKAAAELKVALGGYAGVFDVVDSFSGGKQEIAMSIKPEAEALGLRLSDLARQVRYGFYGAEAQRIQRGDDEVRVMVRYPVEERESVANLQNMYIRTPSGAEVPFDSVAELTLGMGYSSISRIDGVRSISVGASADKGVAEPGKVSKDIVDNVLPDILKKYPDVSYGLDGASKDEAEIVVKLAVGFMFTLMLIYCLLAIPLKSYSQPLVIMSIIPFGMIGAVIGHMILGMPMSMLSMFGVIALAGVVVNDSLIMVDFVGKARSQGMNIIDAATDSGTKRFRAIVLTSLTTFFGLIPIILESSLQAQFVIPMAVSLAFGILFSTVITLLLVPSLYLILDDIKRGLSRKKRIDVGRQPETTSVN